MEPARVTMENHVRAIAGISRGDGTLQGPKGIPKGCGTCKLGTNVLIWPSPLLRVATDSSLFVCFCMHYLLYAGSKPTFRACQLPQGKEKSNDCRTVSRKFQEKVTDRTPNLKRPHCSDMQNYYFCSFVETEQSGFQME